MCFKRYFTPHEFQRENFKSQITLPSSKIHASNYNFKSYQASRLNPLPPSEERLSSKSSSLISACSQNTRETKNTRKFQGKWRYFRCLRIFRIDRLLTFPLTLYKMCRAMLSSLNSLFTESSHPELGMLVDYGNNSIPVFTKIYLYCISVFEGA